MLKSKWIWIVTGMLITTVFLGSSHLLALREVGDSTQDITSKMAQESLLKQGIIVERKASSPLPKSYPMPIRKEKVKAGNLSTSDFVNNVSASQSLPLNQNLVVREKAFRESESSRSHYMDVGILLFLVVLSAIYLIKKKNSLKSRGNAIIFSVVILFVIFVIGTALIYLSQNESVKSKKSNKWNSSLYLADGGVEKALWELNNNNAYAGENKTSLGGGEFSVTVSTPTGMPDRREIVSVGKLSAYQRTIKVVCEKDPSTITVNSALGCGGDVNVGGNANVAGDTITGIMVPVGSTVNTSGGGAVSGNPPTGNAPFPTFEEVFGISEEEMQAIATTKYVNPSNNSPATKITWVTGNFAVSTTGWYGTGILVIDGNFNMTGGQFDGVIFITGSFKMSGNAVIRGGIYTLAMADVAGITGTSSISYDAAKVSDANNLYPFKIISWQEVKN